MQARPHDNPLDLEVLQGVEVPALLKLVECAHYSTQERNLRLMQEVGRLTLKLERAQDTFRPCHPRRMSAPAIASDDREFLKDTTLVLPSEVSEQQEFVAPEVFSEDGILQAASGSKRRSCVGFELGIGTDESSAKTGSTGRPFGRFLQRQKTGAEGLGRPSARRTAWSSDSDNTRHHMDMACKKFTERDRMMGSFYNKGSADVTTLSFRQRCIRRSQKLLESRAFEYFMGIIILLNSLCLGVQSELSLPGRDAGPEIITTLEVVENVFLSIYVIEACVTIMVRGKASFHDPWFLFDLCLVVVGTLYQWCLRFVIDPDGGDFLQQVLVLRTLRLLRLLRALRLLPMLRVVWRLTFGLLTSTSAMLSTFALIVLILYMFGCLGLELITKNDRIREIPELLELVDNNFASLSGTMITLMQFVTLDSISSIYCPLVREFPGLLLYFLPIILIVSISLMNMVTAVLVESALTQANNDREVQKYIAIKKTREERPIFQALFKQLDKDGNQSIELSELSKLDLADFPPLFRQAFQDFKFESVLEMFEILDCDVSGSIMEEEFVDGFLNLSLAEFQQVPPELILILKLSRAMGRKNSNVLQEISNLKYEMKRLLAELTPKECPNGNKEVRVTDDEHRQQREEHPEGQEQRWDGSTECLS